MNSLNSVIVSAMGRFGILILLFLASYVSALAQSDDNRYWKNPPVSSHANTMRSTKITAPLCGVDFTSNNNENYNNDDDNLSTVGVQSTSSQPLVEERIRVNQQQQTSQQPHNFDERVSNSIASSILQFALNLGQELSRANVYQSTSEVFSPLSLMSALAMLLLGAKGNSYQELSRIFLLDSHLLANRDAFHQEFAWLLDDIQQHPNATSTRLRKPADWRNTIKKTNIRIATRNSKPNDQIVKVANGLFAQSGYSINVNYRNVITSVYGSELVELDFQGRSSDARDYINQWVKVKTFDKIPKIITDDISKSTNVILASVLYFKGFWENSFFDRGTVLDNFFPDGLDRQPIQVQMMSTGGVFPFYNSIDNDCRIIGLPYKGNLTTMYIIQPNYSTRERLNWLQSALNAAKIEDMISKMERKTAVLAFPKMHLIRSVNMKNLLTRFGINDIFNKVRSDLSLIGGVHNIGVPVPAAPSRSNVILDRFNEPAHIFPQNQQQTTFNLPLAEKSTQYPSESGSSIFSSSNSRKRRATNYDLSADYSAQALHNLETERNRGNYLKSDFFVDDIVHKVDVEINEQGTEAAAATMTYLRRSGTDVVFRAETPFLILIRHDPTKVVLFYAIINEPQ